MAYDIKGSGARIRQLRIQNGYTQEKLAEEVNVDQSYYGRIETGKRGCPVDLFIQLSDLFGVSLDYLIRGRSGSDLPGDIEATAPPPSPPPRWSTSKSASGTLFCCTWATFRRSRRSLK